MAPKQRMRIANEKATKNITLRGNVPKSSVSFFFIYSSHFIIYIILHADVQQLAVMCHLAKFICINYNANPCDYYFITSFLW